MKDREVTLNLTPNVIDGEELETLFDTVFSQMAYYVSRTYGPFGGTTSYQEMNRILTTKDGWTVEQGIKYSKNVLANLIRAFIIEVSRSINTHAGDGTTTGVIAANEINKLVIDYKKKNKIHSKFLSNALKYCVDCICNQLKSGATKITDENMDDIIYRIAEVSLDWDKEFAGYIRDIYRETHNPIIRVQNSGYESSFVEYMEGYDVSAKLISEFKVNNIAEKKCTVENPAILVFSYTVAADLFEPLLTVATYFRSTQNRELIILAPDFEKNFRDAYNSLCIKLIKNKQELPSLIMTRYFGDYTIDREILNDFCFLIGANIISREYNDAETLIKDFEKVGKMVPPQISNYGTDRKSKEAFNRDSLEFNNTIKEISDKFKNEIVDYVGTCSSVSIDSKMLLANGFNGMETSDAIETRKGIIQAEIDKSLKDMTAKSMFTEEIRLKKLRLGKLCLKMGIINVGGFGDYNLKATRDALDDAINACSNAYLEGVVTGGGVAIPTAINKLKSKLSSGEWNPSEEKGVDNSLVESILDCINKGFINTWKIMLTNRYTDNYVEKSDISVDDLIAKCIEIEAPWNLITEEFDKTIIHPVKVETEIVKGCLHLVLTTTTTNQLLYNGFEGIDEELEDMREVKEA